MDAPFPEALNQAIAENYATLTAKSGNGATFAVRSSATAEDLPDASFAGQQESFLNIQGLDNILHAIKEVFASLYNDRAISYRVHKGFVHAKEASGKSSAVADERTANVAPLPDLAVSVA